MASLMQWSVDLTVRDGPEVAVTSSFSPAAYSVAEIEVDAGDSETLPLQPGASEDVRLLLITASQYSSADLEYELGGETVALDAPQLFTGAGMLSLFSSDPEDVTINNDLTESVTVKIVVGRTAP